MPKKPSKKKTAKVQLDAATVHKFESHLRDGLVATGAVMATENVTPSLKSRGKVEIDQETAARLAQVLRDGLVSSAAVLATEYSQQYQAPAKEKKKAKKGGRSKPGPKKR